MSGSGGGDEVGDNFELLLARAKKGNAEAAGKLFCAYRKRLWRVCPDMNENDEATRKQEEERERDEDRA